MSYYPAGAEFALALEEREYRRSQSENIIIEREIQDTYEDAVSKFYSCGVSYKTAEALAKLWAQAFVEHEWEDKNAAHISSELGLEWKEAYAILGEREKLRKIIETEKFWR